MTSTWNRSSTTWSGRSFAAMGHHVVRVKGDDDQFGGYQAVLFQRDPALAPPEGSEASRATPG